jgi:hypothetical protein
MKHVRPLTIVYYDVATKERITELELLEPPRVGSLVQLIDMDTGDEGQFSVMECSEPAHSYADVWVERAF